MKVAVIADVHLDTKFAGLDPKVAAIRRGNIRKSLERAVALASEQGADALFVAGDLYEQERFVADTGRFLARVFEDFSPGTVLLAPGNHDWWGPQSLYEMVRWSPNVHVFEGSDLECFQLEDGLWVWGAAHQASRTDKNFFEGFEVPGGGIHLGLIHGSEMSRLASEKADNAEKFAHAPFQESDLERAGLSHLFAGHYHRASSSRLCTYPGNPDPLTFGEDRRSNPRGIVFVTIAPSGEIEIAPPQDVSVSSVFSVDVDVGAAADKSQLVEAVLEKVATVTDGRVQDSYIKISLLGRVDAEVDLDSLDSLIASELSEAASVVVETSRLGRVVDYDEYLGESSIRGEFLRVVSNSTDLDDAVKERVIACGIAALEGHNDLL